MTSGTLVRGREALSRQAWGDAYAQLTAADGNGRLGAADLDGAATAAYLTGRGAEAEELWARAFRAYADGGEPGRAARVAFWLGLTLLLNGEAARGGGWLGRGARLLEPGGDSAEAGLLLLPAALQALRGGDPAGALEACARAEGIGELHDDPDVLALARLGSGQALIALEQVERGISLLDEAMVAVTADAVSPIAAGIVYCAVLLACRETFDVARAEEWTAALGRWCDSQQDLVPFRGECLVHRAEVLQARGEWAAALAEAARACTWLEGRPAEGRAHYRLGELHRLRGEYAHADRDFSAASAAGRQPQPGCALLRLAQGHADAAEAMVARAAETARDGVGMAGVLPAYVEIALARRNVPLARRAAEDLGALAAERRAAFLDAVSAHALGTVLLAEGDARGGAALLQDSCARWQQLASPYELAQARVATADACRALGDDDGARMELDAARGLFERLGAGPDLERVERLLGRRDGARDGGLTVRELEVLAHVAEGRTNAEIAAALVVSPHTVRRHLQNVYRKLGVHSRTAATAHVLQHGLVGMARKDH
jgi:DNA-binding CsgD family transcriptional regulator